MPDETYTIPEDPQYLAGAIRRLQNGDPLNADESINPVIEAILESMEFLNQNKIGTEGMLKSIYDKNNDGIVDEAENGLHLYKAEIQESDWTFNGKYYTASVSCVSVKDGSVIPSDCILSAPMCLRDMNPALNSGYLNLLNLINSATIRILNSGIISIFVTSQPTSYMELYFYGKKESDITYSNQSFILPGGNPAVKTTAENALSAATEAKGTANSALSKANAALPQSGGAMTGTLSNPSSAQVRNIQASTSDLTAGSSSLTSGCVYLVYE